MLDQLLLAAGNSKPNPLLAFNQPIFLGCSLSRLYASMNLSAWSTKPLGTITDSVSILDLEKANGYYAGTTTLGYIISSQDGNTWVKSGGPNGNHIRAIAFGNGLWVAGNDLGQILRSTGSAPTNWYGAIASGFTTSVIYGITYAAGLFVAVGGNGKIGTSPDGVTWTARASGYTGTIFDVIYANGQFIAVCNDGGVITSPDGITWTRRVTSTTNRLLSITYGNGLYVAVGLSGVVTTSPDGINWSAGNSGTTSTLQCCKFIGDVFIAGLNSTNVEFITSVDGMNWNPKTTVGTSASIYSLIG